MNIRSAKDVIAVAEARGFKVVVKPGPPPMPVLRKPPGVERSAATDALMEALRAWRLEIIEELSAPNESKPDKTPDDWQKQHAAESYRAGDELMKPDGSVVVAGENPAADALAMYWRRPGEASWATIPLPGREGRKDGE